MATRTPSADTRTLVWPTGGFQWTPEWRRRLPVVRGVHVPPLPAREAVLARPFELARDDGSRDTRMQWFRTRFHSEWRYWGPDEAKRRLTPEALAQTDCDFWLCLFAQTRCESGYFRHDNDPATWAVQACATLHGPAFALALCLDFIAVLGSQMQDWPGPAGVAALRHSIAAADEAEHERTRQAAAGRSALGFAQELVRAGCFPHLPQWSGPLLTGAQRGEAFLNLLTCEMPITTFEAGLEAAPGWKLQSVDLVPGLLLQVHLHGEAALELVARIAGGMIPSRDAKTATLGVGLLANLHAPGTLPTLLRHAQHQKAHDAVEKFLRTHPVAVLLSVIRHALAGRSRAAEAWAVRLAIDTPDALGAALAELEPPARARFQALLDAMNPVEADAQSLPDVLRVPPWMRPDRPGELPVLEVAMIATPDAIEVTPGQVAAGRAFIERRERIERDTHGFPVGLKLSDAGARRLLAGLALEPGDTSASYASPGDVLASPAPAQLALWNSFPPHLWSLWSWSSDVDALLVALGTSAIPGLVAALGTHVGKGPQIALRLDTPLLVDRMTGLLRNSRMHRDNAGKWILKYPRTALMRALPQAFAPAHSAVRDDARHAIRWLAERGHRDAVLAAAQAYGPAMRSAALALLDTDPLFVLPGEMPPLPDWLDTRSLHRPALRTGGAVPLGALQAIAKMLIISQPDAPYPGLALVRQACTAASLGDFAWDVYEAWAAAGAPAKEHWAFRGLGLLGDDETARRLMPRITEWGDKPGTRGRAEAALQLLAAIGTDVALMLLNVQAVKGRHKRVQLRAAAMIEAVADQRGLTMDEMGDRLAPTLGLDGPGASELDFGPRRFTIAFDEALKPFVRDARGARLKDLPKPLKTDDAERSTLASERYRQLKKDVRSVASLEITRLERAMVNRRRWTAGAFRAFFLEHPLVRHLAHRLVWGHYQGGRLVQPFCVAEDWSLSDIDDHAWTLPDDGEVGIVHRLDLDEPAHQRASQRFADYEILQPFRQLARETYALTSEEAATDRIKRFDGRDVATGAVIGLDKRGWDRGSPQDGGMILDYWREDGRGARVRIALDPGVFVGGGVAEARQSLGELWIERASAGESGPPLRFGDLDPVFASEVLRDLDLLNPALARPAG